MLTKCSQCDRSASDDNVQKAVLEASLMTFAQLSKNFQSSIDSFHPEQSHGLDVPPGLLPIRESSVPTTETQTVSAKAKSKLVDETAERLRSMQTATLRDAELDALRLLSRPTIEMLFLTMIDKAARHDTDKTGLYEKCLGPDLGSAFEELVESVRGRRALEDAASALQASVPSGVAVRRQGATVVIPSTDVLPGDIMLLHNGERCPAFGILLMCRDQCSVDVSQVTGRCRPIHRSVGYRPSRDFASRNVVPKGSLVYCTEAVVLAVEGAKEKESVKCERLTAPTGLNFLREVQLFAPSQPELLSTHRLAFPLLAASDVVVIDSEGILEYDGSLDVEYLVCGQEIISVSADSQSTWDRSDVLNARDASSLLAVRPLLANPGIRRLLVAAMLSVLDDVPCSGHDIPGTSWNTSREAVSVKQWIAGHQWSDLSRERYHSDSQIVCSEVKFRGQESCWLRSRMFTFDSRSEAATSPKILLVWGPVRAVAAICSTFTSRRGVVTGDSTQDPLEYEEDGEGIGFATAEVPMVAHPDVHLDLSSMIAQTNGLCSLGSIHLSPHLLKDNVKSLATLLRDTRIICTSTATRSISSHFCRRMNVCCGEGCAFSPDAVIDLSEEESTTRMAELLQARPGFFLVCNITTPSQRCDLVRLLSSGNSHGVAYVGSIPASVAAMQTGHVSVACRTSLGTDVSRVADIVVKNNRLDSLIAAIKECRAHLEANQLVQ